MNINYFTFNIEYNDEIEFRATFEKAKNNMLVPTNVVIIYDYTEFESVEDLIDEIPELEYLKNDLQNILEELYSKTYTPQELLKCLSIQKI